MNNWMFEKWIQEFNTRDNSVKSSVERQEKNKKQKKKTSRYIYNSIVSKEFV